MRPAAGRASPASTPSSREADASGCETMSSRAPTGTVRSTPASSQRPATRRRRPLTTTAAGRNNRTEREAHSASGVELVSPHLLGAAAVIGGASLAPP
jgi:hypothetical protein